MVTPNCAVCGRKKLRFIKKQETSGLLSSLGIRAPSNRILLISALLF